MTRATRLTVAFAVLLGPGAAFSQPNAEVSNPADLMRVMAPGCDWSIRNQNDGTKDDAFLGGLCAGTIRTVANIEHDLHIWGFCIPKAVIGGQIISAVSMWVDQHPESLDQPELPVIIKVLKQTWPCSP
jgi:Rap1a immunity proteins